MELILMVGCMSLFGMAVMALAFGAATRSEDHPAVVEEVAKAVPAPGRFFGEELTAVPRLDTRVPIEVLLMQIENHVRVEQAAAESFLAYPTAALLHSKTISPLVH